MEEKEEKLQQSSETGVHMSALDMIFQKREETMEHLSFYTINEVADMLGVSRVTVARWCNSGEIPAYRLGRKWKINKAEFDAWLQERKNAKED